MKKNKVNDILKNLLNDTFVKYCFVGGFSTVFDWGTYTTLLFFNINYLLATCAGFMVGIIVNYILSKKMVFITESKIGKYDIFAYIAIGLIGLLLSMGLMYGFVNIFKSHKLFSRMFVTILVLFWNYFARKNIY